jgi:predicted Fe-Mo cluster-binding NifX family protein
MKIAVATDDFVHVTGHVGRCNGFIVYEIEENKILSSEQRENNFTHHKTSSAQPHSHGHSHFNLVNGLSDCSTLICTSAGWRLQEDFNNNSKELVFTNETLAEDAALKFVTGTLAINSDGACRAH